MAHTQKLYFVFRRNGRVHFNRLGRQFSRLLAAEVCASAVVMLDTPCSEVVWRVLATHSSRQFPLHFTSCASPFDITFQLDTTNIVVNCHLGELGSDATTTLKLLQKRSFCKTDLTFRHRASCILGQAFHYSPENAFYILNQQI